VGVIVGHVVGETELRDTEQYEKEQGQNERELYERLTVLGGGVQRDAHALARRTGGAVG